MKDGWTRTQTRRGKDMDVYREKFGVADGAGTDLRQTRVAFTTETGKSETVLLTRAEAVELARRLLQGPGYLTPVQPDGPGPAKWHVRDCECLRYHGQTLNDPRCEALTSEALS